MSKNPETWGKPVTVRFEPKQLEAIAKAMEQLPLAFGFAHSRRLTFSEFVRAASVERAEAMIRERLVSRDGEDIRSGARAAVAAYDARSSRRKTPRRRNGPKVKTGRKVKRGAKK
jgi:hypothetical protein